MFFAELSFLLVADHLSLRKYIKCLIISHEFLPDDLLNTLPSLLNNQEFSDLICSGHPTYIAHHEFSDVSFSSSFRILFNFPWSCSTSSSSTESEILSIIRSFTPHRRNFNSISSINSSSDSDLDISIARHPSISFDITDASSLDSSIYYDSNGRLSIYGFEREADIHRPPYLMFDYTNICNARCIHCPQSVGFEGQGKKGNLSLETIKSTLESVSTNPPEIIRITGDGEPLMNPIFFPSLDLIKSYQLNRITAITTNGSLLTQKSIDSLISFNPLLIDISLDALSEDVYSIVRVGLNFNTVISNVLNLIAARDKASSCNTKIIVSFVQQDANNHEVDGFRNFWKEKADEVLIREMISNVGKTSTALSSNGIKRWPCVHWFRRSVVVYDSSVKSCPIDWDSRTKVADTCSPSLVGIWQNSVYNTARMNHIFEEIPDNHICKDCVDWQGTPWNKGYVQFIQDNLQSND